MKANRPLQCLQLGSRIASVTTISLRVVCHFRVAHDTVLYKQRFFVFHHPTSGFYNLTNVNPLGASTHSTLFFSHPPTPTDLFPELTQIFARHSAIVLRGSRPLPKQVRVTRNDTVVTVYLYERLRLPRSRLVHINIVPTARTQHINYCASVALFAFDLLGL